MSDQVFAQERPRLVGMAAKILGDAVEAEDIVQTAWLRLRSTQRPDSSDPPPLAETAGNRRRSRRHGSSEEIENVPAWLTTVTVRLCLDRLRRRVPTPEADIELPDTAPDPADDVELAETVGVALQAVIDRLGPRERIAFVLHDSFGFEFATIAEVLDTTPTAARTLASRARAKVRRPAVEDGPADWEVVDAFLAAARHGEFERLLELLAPDAAVGADRAAVLVGTPHRIDGREQVATFFNGAAASALPVFVGDRPGAAWFDRGTPRVAFDFVVTDGLVHRIDFRAEPVLLGRLVRRAGDRRREVGRR